MKAFYLISGLIMWFAALGALLPVADDIDFWGFIILSNMYLIASTNAR